MRLQNGKDVREEIQEPGSPNTLRDVADSLIALLIRAVVVAAPADSMSNVNNLLLVFIQLYSPGFGCFIYYNTSWGLLQRVED